MTGCFFDVRTSLMVAGERHLQVDLCVKVRAGLLVAISVSTTYGLLPVLGKPHHTQMLQTGINALSLSPKSLRSS